jgi:hypothetical protein
MNTGITKMFHLMDKICDISIQVWHKISTTNYMFNVVQICGSNG